MHTLAHAPPLNSHLLFLHRCVDNFFSAAASALEFAACLRLRHAAPAMARPYRIPLGTRALAAFFCAPLAANLVVMCARPSRPPPPRAGAAVQHAPATPFLPGRYVTARETTLSLVICLAAMALGFAGYFACQCGRAPRAATAS